MWWGRRMRGMQRIFHLLCYWHAILVYNIGKSKMGMQPMNEITGVTELIIFLNWCQNYWFQVLPGAAPSSMKKKTKSNLEDAIMTSLKNDNSTLKRLRAMWCIRRIHCCKTWKTNSTPTSVHQYRNNKSVGRCWDASWFHCSNTRKMALQLLLGDHNSNACHHGTWRHSRTRLFEDLGGWRWCDAQGV